MHGHVIREFICTFKLTLELFITMDFKFKIYFFKNIDSNECGSNLIMKRSKFELCVASAERIRAQAF